MQNLSPEEKHQYFLEIGTQLVQSYGKQDSYSPEQVQEAHSRTKWNTDLGLTSELGLEALELGIETGPELYHYAMSIFSTKVDFDTHFEGLDKVADYAAMKAEFLKEISISDIVETAQTIPAQLELGIESGGEILADAGEAIGDFWGDFFEGIFGLFE